MTSQGLWIGWETTGDKGKHVIDSRLCAKHLGIFGSTGSGKTVLGKIIIEEMARQGIPSIVIDPQGDIASMVFRNDDEILRQNDIDLPAVDAFYANTRVRVFTPSSNKGEQISLNPVVFPPFDMDEIEVVRILDNVSGTMVDLLVKLVKYPTSKEMQSKNLIYTLLHDSWRRRKLVDDLRGLTGLVEDDDSFFPSIMNKNDKDKLALSLNNLLIGATGLLFTGKNRLNISDLLRVEGGRVPVNVFFLKTLLNENEKYLFISILLQSLYAWMIQQGSTTGLKCFFYMDEVAPFMPAGMSSPPGKEMLLLLLRQARKYGVSCAIASQSPKDIDYHGLDQINSLFFGRIIAQQSQKVIKGLLSSKLAETETETILNEITSLETAHFISILPDIKDRHPVIPFKARFLFSKHLTLTEADLKVIYSQEGEGGEKQAVQDVEPQEQETPPVFMARDKERETPTSKDGALVDLSTVGHAFVFGDLDEKMMADVVSRTVNYEYNHHFTRGIHVEKTVVINGNPRERLITIYQHLAGKQFELVEASPSPNGLPVLVFHGYLGVLVTCGIMVQNGRGIIGFFIGVEHGDKKKEAITLANELVRLIQGHHS